jgi:hypothetical protein
MIVEKLLVTRPTTGDEVVGHKTNNGRDQQREEVKKNRVKRFPLAKKVALKQRENLFGLVTHYDD